MSKHYLDAYNPETSKLGTELTQAEQKHVLATFVHRFTRNHVPAWSRGEWKDGKSYPVQFASDADWLAHTRFAVKKDGTLNTRADSCHSSPTWPDNPENRKPTP